MIEAFEGRIGGGKTLSAVARALNYWARDGIVASNVEFIWEECKAYGVRRLGMEFDDRQLIRLDNDDIPRFWERVPRGTREKPVLVIIDEADVWLANKTAGVHIDPKMFNFLKQSRKLGMDVIFITQALANLTSQIQRLCQYVWRFRDMEKWGIHALRLMWPFPQILQVQFDYDGKTLLNKRLWNKDKELFKCYNTNALYDQFVTADASEVAGVKARRVHQKKEIPDWVLVVLAAVVVLLLLLS